MREEEFNHISRTLANFGIPTYNAEGSLRYLNEVMVDIAEFLRKRRNETDPNTFYIEKKFILETILGKRYVNEFLV